MVFLSNHNLTKKYLFLLPLLFLGVGNGQAPVDIFTHATKITSHSGWLEWKTDSSYFEEKRQFNLGHRTREILYCDIYNKRSVFKVKTLSLKYLTDSCTAPTISPNKQWALYGVDCESGVQIIAEQLNGKSIVSWHTSFDQSKEEGASLNRVVWISNEKWAMTISTLPHLYWLVGDLKRPGKVQKFNLKIHERMNGWSRHDLRIIGATDSNTALAVGPCWPAKSDVKHKIVQLSLF